MTMFSKPAAKDMGMAAVLIIAALGLGIYSGSRWEKKKSHLKNEGSVLPHPVLSLIEFRSYVESRSAPVFDARRHEEFNAGHVPGALSLPASDFDAVYEKLKSTVLADRNALIIVYCSDMWCGLAEEVQQKLVIRGFQHVATFPDGWQAWHGSGLLVEKAP